MMDALDRRIVNELQDGFPVSDRPYADVAARLGVDESDLIERLGRLLDRGVLTRFGPMYNAERLGGAVTLAAMAVPEDSFDAVAERINAFAEVAHNYERAHRFNMWFVIAADSRARIDEVIAEIEAETGLAVHDMPKRREFFVGLRFEA